MLPNSHSVLRRRRPYRVESLEDRRLLASDIFAVFDGEVDVAGEASETRFLVSDNDFRLRGGKTLLGFHAQAVAGSALDPAGPLVTQVVAQVGRAALSAELRKHDLPGSDDSLAIYELSRGRFVASVGGEGNSTGDFTLDVYLVGDANGDRRVDYLDIVRIAHLARPNLPWLPGGLGQGINFDAGLGRNALNPLDVNGDGWVNNGDFARLSQLLRQTGGGPVSQLGSLFPRAYPDVNGDGAFSNLDGVIMAGFLRGLRRGYAVEADSDRDGRITTTDLRLAARNLGDRTTLDPLTIDVSLTPTPVRSEGMLYTDQAEISLRGMTKRGMQVKFDADADGSFDDGTTTANSSGRFQFDATLTPGENRLRVMVRDTFGQRLTAGKTVTYLPDELDRALFTDPGVQQMPSVAVNPLDPEHVVVAYMDYSLPTADVGLPGEGYAGIGVAVSRNGGLTWQRSRVALPEGFDQGAADPIIRFDGRGRVYVSFMAVTYLGAQSLPPLTNSAGGAGRARGFESNNGIFVARSDDGGDVWNPPVAVASHQFDGVVKTPFDIISDLAIDTFEHLPDGRLNPNFGSLYAVWSRYFPSGQFPGQPQSNGGSRIQFALSSDGGRTWELKRDENDQLGLPASPVPSSFGLGQAPPGLGAVNWSHVAVGPEGDIYVSMFDFDAFKIYHSTDGGNSFTVPDLVTGAGFPFGSLQTISPASTQGLPTNRFRTQVVRAIVADPMRPGHIYAAEADKKTDAVGNVIDPADIRFSRSTDYGRTWTATTQVGGRVASVLNDDNDGQRALGVDDDVISGQAMVRMAVDARGNLALIWYDTRRDPANHRLDVFATVSSDGGESFSSNFRLTGDPFDADRGVFSSAAGEDNYYLGDYLGLALGDDQAYAAWTDTRLGNQDIRFTEFTLARAEAPLNDRFESNDRAEVATRLGPISLRRFNKLAIVEGDEDWYSVEAVASGDFKAIAIADKSGSTPEIEIWDESGRNRLASSQLASLAARSNESEAAVAARSGDRFLVRVLRGESDGRYALEIRSLTADLGARVYGAVDGVTAAGDEAYYLLRVPADGALVVTVTPDVSNQEAVDLEILSVENLAVLARAAASNGPLEISEASLNVESGQQLLIHVHRRVMAGAQLSGNQGASSFRLEFANLDPFENLGERLLRFAVGEGASQTAFADFNGDGAIDAAVSDALADTVYVLLGNGDGTFQAPRASAVGASPGNLGDDLLLPTYRRDLVAGDLNGDGLIDLITANYSASDVSVLLGQGDGTFQSQRRYNATATPYALAIADITGDDELDLLVHDSLRRLGGDASLSTLFGRGDGTLRAEQTLASPISTLSFWPDIDLGDINRDGHLDIAVVGDLEAAGGQVLLGNGAGQFTVGADLPIVGLQVELADVNGDDILDAISANKFDNTIQYSLGRADATFSPPVALVSGQSPVALALADIGSQISSGAILGPPDGLLDIIVANSGVSQPSFAGPPSVVVLPGLSNAGAFSGFGRAIKLADAKAPQNIDVQDLNSDGLLDVIAVDSGDMLVYFGAAPVIPTNSDRESARDLGIVVHLLQPIETITPTHTDDFFVFTVPNEFAPDAGDQIVDISALFEFEDGAGLALEVHDSEGNLLGAGERLRLAAAPLEQLYIHVFGRADDAGIRGTGAFTLAIDVLPQLVGVEAQTLLPGVGNQPGGPTASLVLTLQGDRLDRESAQDPANYVVTFLGSDDALGGGDDQVITVAEAVYNAGANLDVSSGLTFPTAIRQTINLLLDAPLPVGSYRIELSSDIQAAPFNDQELGRLAGGAAFNGHPIATRGAGGAIHEGASVQATDLVLAEGAVGDFSDYLDGTRFLTQLHNDLSAILDDLLATLGDDPSITDAIAEQIVQRFEPALGPVGARRANMLIIFLDPVEIEVENEDGEILIYDQDEDEVDNEIPDTFVEVGGNVEIIVIANPVGEYDLTVSNVPALPRGTVVTVNNSSTTVTPLTNQLRSGQTTFTVS